MLDDGISLDDGLCGWRILSSSLLNNWCSAITHPLVSIHILNVYGFNNCSKLKLTQMQIHLWNPWKFCSFYKYMHMCNSYSFWNVFLNPGLVNVLLDYVQCYCKRNNGEQTDLVARACFTLQRAARKNKKVLWIKLCPSLIKHLNKCSLPGTISDSSEVIWEICWFS